MPKIIKLRDVDAMPDGVQQFVFIKVSENGSTEPHRASIYPGADFDARIGEINAHLMHMGYPAIDAADVDVMRDTITAAYTPEFIAAWSAAQPADR